MSSMHGSSGATQARHQERQNRLQEVLAVLLRGKWIILGVTSVTALAVAAVNLLMKPVYESSAMVLVDSKGAQVAFPFMDLTGTAGSSRLANEIETLRSHTVAAAVAERLVQVRYADSARSELLVILTGANRHETAPLAEVIRRVERSVDISPIKETDIIKITARSQGRLEAALIVSTYTDVFEQRNREMTLEKSRAVREFLQDQMKTQKTSLNEKDSTLQEYMRKSNVVSLDEETKKLVEQMAQLEAARGSLDVEITVKRNTLASYSQELGRLEPRVAKTVGDYGDSYIRLLQDQLAKLEVQRDIAVSQNPGGQGESSYAEQINGLDAQMATLKKKLEERTRDYLATLAPSSSRPGSEADGMGYLGEVKQKIVEERIALNGLLARKEALERVLAGTEQQFNGLPRKEITLAKLQRARLSTEKLYLMVEEKFNEAAIKERSEFADIAVIDPPAVPDEPVSPRVFFNIFLGLLGGLALGVATVLVRNAADVRFYAPDDVAAHGYRLFATIRRLRWIKQGKERSGLLEDGRWYDTRLVPLFHPFDPATEAYRHLLTSIAGGDEQNRPKRIMFTSANPGEGKTTTVANLAVTAAQLRKRVLLIDADLRRPSLHKLFNIAPSPGLSDYIRGIHRFDEVVRVEVLENLDVICAGTLVENSARILTSWRLKEFLDKLAPAYDLFLFDTPPVLAVTDPALLCSSMDLALLVVSGGTTKAEQLERAEEMLKTAGAAHTGVVFNNYDVRKAYGGGYKTDLYGYTEYSYTSPGSRSLDPRKKLRRLK